MNDIWTTVAWSSFQVTLVAAAALFMERVASRRGPCAGSWVAAASLVFIAAITPLALWQPQTRSVWPGENVVARAIAIAPHRPAPHAGTSSGSEEIASGPGNHDAQPAPLGDFWRSVVLHRLQAWALREPSIRARCAAWAPAWGLFLSVGAAFGLCRLGIGLWGVRACRSRSTPVSDAALLALVESLRNATRCRRPIEVREWAARALTAAAAVGWRRPLILLPGEWRDWNQADLRAVLAHEVAHIARGDYAAGLLARFGLALHFYHPLVHWIAARMLLQQELAADARAARLCGGRRPYLLALSRLALRLEETTWSSPAKMFLPARGQLIRRIQMLKSNTPQRNSPLAPIGRAIAIVVLCAVGLAVASLRGPTRSAANEKPVADGRPGTPLSAPDSKTPATPASRAPFDLSYLAGHDMGFVATRPSSIFHSPGMKPYAEELNAEIAELLKAKGIKGVSFDVASIEQAVIGLNILPRNREKKQPGRIMTGAFVLRSVQDRDWLPLVKALAKAFIPKFSGLTLVRFNGRDYYTSACPALGANAGFYFPDGRTLVFAREEEVRAMIKHPENPTPSFLTGNDWKQASTGLYAVAMNNSDRRWKIDEMPDSDARSAGLIEASNRVILGLDWGEMFTFNATFTYSTESAAERALKSLQAILIEGGPELEKLENSAKSKKLTGAQDFYRVARLLLAACATHRNGRSVELQGRKKLTAPEIAALGPIMIGG